jgi:AAA+ ATPase superfamily predicted ATPase
MKQIIGRKYEMEILASAMESSKSELIVVYGRRRVGKTYLIREFFEHNICFEVTGLFNGSLTDQLDNFAREIKRRTKTKKIASLTKWIEAFALLEQYLDNLKGKGKKVVFVDEFPWIATRKSKFLMAFENFWNRFASKRKDLVVIICGSAASYMIQNIIKNKGGLHNRLSHKIRLLPFNLNETELFLRARKINYTRYDILQLYMVMGGIPHYLEKIKRGKSTVQNIDLMCFDKDGILNDEFNQLFASLFSESDTHLKMAETLSSVKKESPETN